MIKVAMVQSDGQVAYTISPAVDDMYVDGQEYSGCVARHISHESNDQDVINTWYWNNGWQTRDSQPSVYHEWVDSAWAFSGALFWGDVRGSRDIKLYLLRLDANARFPAYRRKEGRMGDLQTSPARHTRNAF